MSKTLEPPLSFYFVSKEGLSEGLLFHAFSAQFSYMTIFRQIFGVFSTCLTPTYESFKYKKRLLTQGKNQCCVYT